MLNGMPISEELICIVYVRVCNKCENICQRKVAKNC